MNDGGQRNTRKDYLTRRRGDRAADTTIFSQWHEGQFSVFCVKKDLHS